MDEQDSQKIKEGLEELKNLITVGKQEISNSEVTLKNLNQIVTSIQNYNQKFDDVRKKIEETESSITTNLESSKKTKLEIDTLRQESEAQLATIKTVLTSIQANITTMNAEYLKFVEINSTISNPESGLSSVFKKSNILKSEIDKFRTDSEIQLTVIKTALATIQANIAEMTKYHADFLILKATLDDPENGLANIHDISTQLKDEITALKTQSDTLFQEIKKFRDEAKNYTKEIEALKKVSEENTKTIGVYETESKDLKKRIENIYKIATDTGLANSFDERRKGLEKATNAWFWALMSSTFLLAISLVVIFLPVLYDKSISIDAYIWYRLTLTSPLIFFIAFASVRYSKERSLLEKYAFKAVTALSLEGYTTLLINTFGKEKEKNEQDILNFVLQSMSSIYKEPHEATKESKINFAVDTKFASLKTNLAETMGETRKELINTIKEEVKAESSKILKTT